MVPIDGRRVEAAIKRRGWSVNSVAKKIGMSQPTLNSVLKTGKRCHGTVREKLAGLLGLPPEFLGGETDLLPWRDHYPDPFVGMDRGSDAPRFVIDENAMLQRVSETGDFRTELPPLYQIAAYELGERIVRAWKRDIEGEVEQATKAKQRLDRLRWGMWLEGEWDKTMLLVHLLLSTYRWRRYLLQPPFNVDGWLGHQPSPVGYETWSAKKKRTARDAWAAQQVEKLVAADELAVGGADALAAALQPWFDGRAELNYRHWLGVLRWVAQFFDPSRKLQSTKSGRSRAFKTKRQTARRD